MTYDCSCDYDRPEFYDAGLVTARKQHRCGECGGSMLPGEKYERVAGKWGGVFSVFATCSRCVDIRTWVKNNVPCLCIMHGNQDEENHGAIVDAVERAPEETVGIRFGLLRRMVERRNFNRKQRLTFDEQT